MFGCLVCGYCWAPYYHRTAFDHHAFALYSSEVYDACVGAELGTKNESSYLQAAIDISTEAERAIADTSFTESDVHDITDLQ